MDSAEAGAVCEAVVDALTGTVIAQRFVLESVLMGVLARGHVLLEDVPGTGKTLTARSLARVLGLSFSRIQFTPDLLPTDVTGTHVFDQKERTFEFRKGPVFANVVLGDEINRAPPKTQAALLEAMEERQVTVAGETHSLPEPFFVIATQNPIEAEGSLHPDETVYLDGELWRAGDALDHARDVGELVYRDEDMRLYEVDASTETLRPDGRLVERAAMVYEVDYVGELYTVRTRSGREIRVSASHPFLVDRAGTIQWVEARDLDGDDTLVVPDRLGSVDRPFPSHAAALERLETSYRVVRRETVAGALSASRAGERLDHDQLEAGRIARHMSTSELATGVDAGYDRVLNYLQGATNGLGHELQPALADGDRPAVSDYVETVRTHRFDRPPTDSEAGVLLGFVLSVGHWTDTSVAIHQSGQPEKFDRWVEIAENLGFEATIHQRDGSRKATIDSRAFVDYLKVRYHLAAPNKLLAGPEAFRRTFLETFVLAGAHYDTEPRRITLTQNDTGLTNLIAHLLLQFGIQPLLKDGDGGYRIEIRGANIAGYLEEFERPGDLSAVGSVRHTHREPSSGPETPGPVVTSPATRRDGELSEIGHELAVDNRDARMALANRDAGRHRGHVEDDVTFDGVCRVTSEPYVGPVIGLSVPDTHNYLAGLGACGISHNTFPLPEAQVDRFAVKTSIGYPDHDGELELLRRRAGRTTRTPTVESVLDGADDVIDLQTVPESVHVDDDVLDYIVRVTRATRDDRHVEVGVSPRGTQRLFESARARAIIEGRDFVTPDDVKTVAVPVLAHRLVLTPDAVVGDVDKGDVVEDVLETQPVPTVD